MASFLERVRVFGVNVSHPNSESKNGDSRKQEKPSPSLPFELPRTLHWLGGRTTSQRRPELVLGRSMRTAKSRLYLPRQSRSRQSKVLQYFVHPNTHPR